MLQSSVKRVAKSQLWCSSLAFSTSTKQMKELPKREYNEPSQTPSLVIRNNHIDNTIWNEIKISDNDIFVNTPAKSGTTWMQEICGQLLYNGDMKSRIGTDKIYDIAPRKYIFVARDFRDITWSFYHHYSLFSEKAYE